MFCIVKKHVIKTILRATIHINTKNSKEMPLRLIFYCLHHHHFDIKKILIQKVKKKNVVPFIIFNLSLFFCQIQRILFNFTEICSVLFFFLFLFRFLPHPNEGNYFRKVLTKIEHSSTVRCIRLLDIFVLCFYEMHFEQANRVNWQSPIWFNRNNLVWSRNCMLCTCCSSQDYRWHINARLTQSTMAFNLNKFISIK